MAPQLYLRNADRRMLPGVIAVDTEPVSTYYVEVNLTLSIDEKVVRKARKAAQSQGLTLNQAVRQFLEELAGIRSADDDVLEMEDLSERSSGHSRGWRFDRDQIHERS